MSKNTETYTPDWISAEDAAKWLGVDIVTLWRWRSKYNLAYTKVGKRTLMYDRRQINQILNSNSTYAVIGDKKLTA